MKGFLAKKTSNSKTTKKQHVLFFFLVISALFWLMTNLSKTYTSSVEYSLAYKNLPPAKLFQSNPSQSIEFTVTGTGFQLLRENLFSRKITLDLKNVTAKDKYTHYILVGKNRKSIQKQLGKNVQFVASVQDSLFFELGLNKVKKIPVIPSTDIQFKLGYNYEGKLMVTPDSVVISGPEVQVDQIKEIRTELLSKKEVFEVIDQEVPLIMPKALDKITYANNSVRLKASVDKFTEDSFNVPFEIAGLPLGTIITTYPKKIQVVFQVGVRNYKKVSADDFKIVCNYATAQKKGVNYLIPELVEKPALVSSVKLIPNHIEYLIQK